MLGVIAAIPTPTSSTFQPDIDRLLAFAANLLVNGCHGLNLLGTTGEATSFDRRSRIQIMERVAARQDLVERMMVGTGAAALDDAVELTRCADRLGYRGALVLPPFYYKGLSDEQISDWISRLIDRVAPKWARIYLYNFPQMTGLVYRLAAVSRLIERHGAVIGGLKDSSGDVAYASELALAFPNFAVFPSNEEALGDAKARGFAGCISATVNVSAGFARAVYDDPDAARASGVFRRMVAMRSLLSRYQLVSAVKAVVADDLDDIAWGVTCPPLQPLGSEEGAELIKAVRLIRQQASTIPARSERANS